MNTKALSLTICFVLGIGLGFAVDKAHETKRTDVYEANQLSESDNIKAQAYSQQKLKERLKALEQKLVDQNQILQQMNQLKQENDDLLTTLRVYEEALALTGQRTILQKPEVEGFPAIALPENSEVAYQNEQLEEFKRQGEELERKLSEENSPKALQKLTELKSYHQDSVNLLMKLAQAQSSEEQEQLQLELAKNEAKKVAVEEALNYQYLIETMQGYGVDDPVQHEELLEKLKRQLNVPLAGGVGAGPEGFSN